MPIDHVDYRDFDPELAREVTDNLQSLTARFPEVDAVRWVSTIQERDRALSESGIDREPPPEAVYAEAAGPVFGEHAGIAYNEQWASDYGKLEAALVEDVSAGWHPPGTGKPAALLTHEFGHMIDHHLEANGVRESHLVPVLKEVCAKHPRWIAENVSGYAAGEQGIRLEREILAEAFAESVHSENPRPVARRIGEAIDDAFDHLRSR